jgi:alginate O-acetyltransferase algI
MLLRRHLQPRLLFVTLFSYYFYYKSSGFYFFLLAIVTVSDFLIARRIQTLADRSLTEKGKERCLRRRRKWLVALSLLIDLGLLGYFKYTNFFAGMVSRMLDFNFQPWDIFLPVGISFFTFQSLSYTIDVYRGNLKPLPRLLDYAFYVSFFPQLVAGPIVRASDFAPQIRKPVVITPDMFARGVYFIIIGLFKKAVISDYISLNFVDRIFDNPTLYSGMENLLGIYGYALQIYCDFSGYSDMAIGIALLLGFRFPLNFNAPYRATSITDFWRRWHISLSTWIRDYIYISLGGNRKGKLRQYINLILTMLLGGLWHGASLNFIVWGGMHGVALAAHKLFSQEILHHTRSYCPRGIRKWVAILLTFHFVCFTWIFFRQTSFSAGQTMLLRIFSDFHAELWLQIASGYKYVLAFMAFGFLTHFLPDAWQERIIAALRRCNVVVCALLLTAVIYIVIQIKSSTIQPFIYFQF